MSINNMVLNNKWVNNDIKEETKNVLETTENEHKTPKASGAQ